MKWFRFYNEIIDDPKIAKMSPKTYQFFTFLMCLASECEQNGIIPLPIKDISWRLRIPEKKIKTYISELRNLNILSDNPAISFINWNKRQYKSDSSNERVKRYREKQCNVTVTPEVTPPEQNRTDTEQNRTEQIKKKDKKKGLVLPDWLPIDLWNDFKKLRVKLKKPLTDKGEKLNLNKLENLKKEGNDPKAVIEQTIMKGWQGFFELPENKGGNDGFQGNAGRASKKSGSDGEKPDKYSGIGRTMLTE